MSKELFMAAHEEAITEYLDENPEADWEEAYDRTVDLAHIRMTQMLADKADAMRQRAKDGE